MRRARVAAWSAAIVACAIAWSACHAAEYGDIKFERKAKGMDDVPEAVFPHWIHRMQFKCTACHGEVFKAKAGANEITMEMIQSGKACGVCHNGKAAFEANFDTCPRCHYK